MTEIEWLINNGMALQNITDGDPLWQNDDKCRYQIVIFIKIIRDTAPCWIVPSSKGFNEII